MLLNILLLLCVSFLCRVVKEFYLFREIFCNNFHHRIFSIFLSFLRFCYFAKVFLSKCFPLWLFFSFFFCVFSKGHWLFTTIEVYFCNNIFYIFLVFFSYSLVLFVYFASCKNAVTSEYGALLFPPICFLVFFLCSFVLVLSIFLHIFLLWRALNVLQPCL